MPVHSTGCRTMKGPARYVPLAGRSAAKDIPAMQEVATNASAIRYFTAIPRPRSNNILGQELSWTVADLSHPTDLAHRIAPPGSAPAAVVAVPLGLCSGGPSH